METAAVNEGGCVEIRAVGIVVTTTNLSYNGKGWKL
jgi:hypothetical protein